MTNFIGESLGRYRILEQVGEGGMASVYRAFDMRLEREVAIKIIRAENFPPIQLERTLKRFEREAKSLAQLSHPNIVKVLDYGEFEGSPYLIMEYLSGGTFKQKLGKPIHYSKAIPMLLPIIRALGYAHGIGIIHRDVKPSNILITKSGEPMLSDFGIAKMFGTEDDISLTGTGVGIGTPEYMSPEQATGKAPSQTADIYSLGNILYEMLTGRKPYIADTPMAVMLKKSTEPLPRPSQFVRDLPQSVDNVLLKALAKNPSNRYQSANDFATALEKILAGDKLVYSNAPEIIDSHRETRTTIESAYEARRKEAKQRDNWALRFFKSVGRIFLKTKKKQSVIEINKQYIEGWKETGTMTVNMIAVLLTFIKIG